MTSIVSSDSLSMVGATRNNTGQFASLGDQGYNGISKKYPDLSVSSSASWNYVGVVIKIEDEFHVFRYSQQQMYASPTILRINSTTGSYIGTASMSTGSVPIPTFMTLQWIPRVTFGLHTVHTLAD